MTDSVKILHCADLHLGSELTGAIRSGVEGRSGAIERRQELLDSFRRICNLCNKEKIDLLLIAGDMFEGSNIDEATLQAVREYLANMEHTIAAIAPGNHDYYAIDSPFADENWPENVIIFRSAKMEKVTFEKRGFAIYGAAFVGTYQHEPLLKLKEKPDSRLINFCVLHGDLVSATSESNYNPVTEAQIEAAGFDYTALGHIHKKSGVLRTGQHFYAYPGCPDGRGFDELGPKGVYIGTVTKTRLDLEFRAICSRMYLVEEVDISDLEAETKIVTSCLAALEERHGDDYDKHFYKLNLTGRLTEGFVLPLASIDTALNEKVHFVKIQDHTRSEIDVEKLAKESSLRGLFVQKMLEQIKKAEKEQNKQSKSEDRFTPSVKYEKEPFQPEIEKLWRAMDIGLMAFEGKVELDDY